VRDPEPGRCGAVLRPDAFSSPPPAAPTQSWLLTVTRDFATWQRDREAIEFDMRPWLSAGWRKSRWVESSQALPQRVFKLQPAAASQ